MIARILLSALFVVGTASADLITITSMTNNITGVFNVEQVPSDWGSLPGTNWIGPYASQYDGIYTYPGEIMEVSIDFNNPFVQPFRFGLLVSNNARVDIDGVESYDNLGLPFAYVIPNRVNPLYVDFSSLSAGDHIIDLFIQKYTAADVDDPLAFAFNFVSTATVNPGDGGTPSTAPEPASCFEFGGALMVIGLWKFKKYRRQAEQ